MITIILLLIVVLGFIVSAVKGAKIKSYKRGYSDAYYIYRSTKVIPDYLKPREDVESKKDYETGFRNAIKELKLLVGDD